MAFIVAMVSQKGGVGKSTLARLLACEFAAQGWNVKIGDLDISQSTSFQWRTRRLQSKIDTTWKVSSFAGRQSLRLSGWHQHLQHFIAGFALGKISLA